MKWHIPEAEYGDLEPGIIPLCRLHCRKAPATASSSFIKIRNYDCRISIAKPRRGDLPVAPTFFSWLQPP